MRKVGRRLGRSCGGIDHLQLLFKPIQRVVDLVRQKRIVPRDTALQRNFDFCLETRHYLVWQRRAGFIQSRKLIDTSICEIKRKTRACLWSRRQVKAYVLAQRLDGIEWIGGQRVL